MPIAAIASADQCRSFSICISLSLSFSDSIGYSIEAACGTDGFVPHWNDTSFQSNGSIGWSSLAHAVGNPGSKYAMPHPHACTHLRALSLYALCSTCLASRVSTLIEVLVVAGRSTSTNQRNLPYGPANCSCSSLCRNSRAAWACITCMPKQHLVECAHAVW
jgi:hypothetical protein